MNRVERPRIALVNPDNRGSYRSNHLPRENLGIGYLSSYLKQHGFDVQIFDARLARQNYGTTAQEVAYFDPILVGISMISKESENWVEPFGEILKSGNLMRPPYITTGNYYPSLQPENVLESMPSVDSVIQGEGEITLLDLATRIYKKMEWKGTSGLVYKSTNGTIVAEERRELVKDLNTLPFPERYADGSQLLELSIEGSRGCFHDCTFCAISPHFKSPAKLKWRGRSPQSIVEEMIILRKKYPGINLYRFVDPDFIGSRANISNVFDFARLVKQRIKGINFFVETRSDNALDLPSDTWIALKEAGLSQVYIGVETGSPKIKQIMSKNSSTDNDEKAIATLNALGINTQYGFMMMTPWTTEEDISLNINSIRRIGFAGLDKFFQEMNLVPGTEAMELVRADGRNIWPDGNSGYYSYSLEEPLNILRQIGRTFENPKYTYFLERLWFLYKDIQRHGQLGVIETPTYKSALKELNLNIFLTCYDEAKAVKSGTDEEVNEIIRRVINNFMSRIKALEERLDPTKCFPRNQGVTE